eukprot:516469-Hanusia_phi.AAC.1
MYSQRPVLACNSGGPTESVLHEVSTAAAPPLRWIEQATGLLCEAGEEHFASGMPRCAEDVARQELGARDGGEWQVIDMVCS